MLSKLVTENRKLKLDGAQQLEGLIKDVRDAISQLRAEAKRHNEPAQDKPQAVQQLKAGDAAGTTPLWKDMKGLSDNISSLANEVKLSASDQMLLNSLHFDCIPRRQAAVAPAHEKTFSWILDPSSPVKFDDWVRSENGVYWIMGKAGSGKSTLMRYLLNHIKTAESLELWAGTKELVTASFFFWNAGTSMQKSQEGLFRSILYEILIQCPDLTRTVCASKAETFRPFVRKIEPWTRQELWHAIGQLQEQSGVRARFCFFIDGLDEYDGEPDHIISILDSLRSWPDVKLCVSSRPYNEFKDAFGRPSDPQLALEDLTREDIKVYVRDTLEENSRFKALKARDDRSQDLVLEIVDKAQGVFLWVVLVVRSLLTGLKNADRICDLQKRLRDFPETLEKYFGHMINSVEPIYQEQTAQAFSFALEAHEPLSLMTYSFLDEEDLDALIAAPLNPLTTQENLSRQDDMRRRLNARCKGLLEVISDRVDSGKGSTYIDLFIAPKVVFHHRTVRDFLHTKDMQNMLLEHLEAGFDPKLRFCKALLAHLKALDYRALRGNNDNKEIPLMLLDHLAYYARRLEIDNHVPQCSLLDEVGRCVSKDLLGWKKGEIEFLGFLVNRRLRLYITETLTTKKSLTQSDKSMLLGAALEGSSRSTWGDLNEVSDEMVYFGGYEECGVEMIEILLKHGAQPNNDYKSSTVWGHFVRSVLDYFALFGPREDELVPIIASLLSHGANLQQRIVTGQKTQARELSGRAADLHKRQEFQVDTVKSAQEILLDILGEERFSELLKKVRKDQKHNPSKSKWWLGQSLRASMKRLKR